MPEGSCCGPGGVSKESEGQPTEDGELRGYPVCWRLEEVHEGFQGVVRGCRCCHR